MSNVDLLRQMAEQIVVLRQTVADLQRQERPRTEAGTYTPTYVGGTTAGVTTYTTRVGEWVRYGQRVYVWAVVAWSSATGTGDGRVSLPFTARNTSNAQYPVAIRTNSLAWSGAFQVGVISANTNYVVIQQIAATSGAATAVPVDSGSAVIAFSAVYPI